MLEQRSFRETAKHFIDGSIHAAFSVIGARNKLRAAYERLLLHVRRRTDLLRPRPRRGDRRGNGRGAINAGILALALHHADWLRDVETWMPATGSPWRQFTSLAHHLFALYPVPAFMTSVWFDPPPGEKLPQHRWFKHLGRGGSLRGLNLPLVITKAMAHRFNQAPDHYSAVMALRWAQVRGLGGDEKLAGAVAATRLGKVLQHEGFWLTVLRFFLRNPRMDLVHVGPIVDFLQHQRFEPREVLVRGVMTRQGAPQPEYSIKGRTLRSMLRQVEEWHAQLGKETKEPTLRWARCGIGEFEISEHLGKPRHWTISELLTNRDLRSEGLALHHCVATYAALCAKRQTSIWSLRIETDDGRKSALTIEVNLATKTICQARGRCNRQPKEHERAILRRWAIGEGLRIAEYL